MARPSLTRHGLAAAALLAIPGCGPGGQAANPSAGTSTAAVVPPAATATAAGDGTATVATASAAATTIASTAPPIPAPADLPPPPLPKGSVVLHVGDSMAGALGEELKLALVARGLSNRLNYTASSNIADWAGEKMGIQSYIWMHKPDMIMVTVGANEVGVLTPDKRIPAIKALVKRISHKPCLWIGIPLWPNAPHSGILDVIRDNCAPCIYVDTNKIMSKMEVRNDGIHPTADERKRWAQFMLRWLLHNRDPNGTTPWSFKATPEPPPPGSEAWLEEL